jgi:predicted dithiol-disulfide oxidoreductase (DUF899 family)
MKGDRAMEQKRVVSQDEWLAAREAFLLKEKVK